MLDNYSDSRLPDEATELLSHAAARYPAETPDPLSPVIWPAGDAVRYAQLIQAKHRLWLVIGRIASDPATGLARTVELTVTGWGHDEEADVRVLAAVKVAPVRNAIVRRLAQRDAHDILATALLAGLPDARLQAAPVDAQGSHPRVGARDALASSTRRRGRPPLPDDFLQRVADAYVEEVSAGTVGLHHALARRFGVPPATIRDWIYKARRREFLPKTSRGRQSLRLR